MWIPPHSTRFPLTGPQTIRSTAAFLPVIVNQTRLKKVSTGQNIPTRDWYPEYSGYLAAEIDSVKIVDEINSMLRARAGTNGQSGVKSVVESLGRWVKSEGESLDRSVEARVGKRVMRYCSTTDQSCPASEPGWTHPKRLFARTIRVSRNCPQASRNKTYQSEMLDVGALISKKSHLFVDHLQSTVFVRLAIRLGSSRLSAWNSGHTSECTRRLATYEQQ